MVAYFKFILFTDSATLLGSSRSSGFGFPVSILQKSHLLVQASPPIRNVASRSSQHSKILGQAASWHTVCSPSVATSERSFVYSGPIVARVLIHSGFLSIGVCEFLASIRRSLRPEGSMLILKPALALGKCAFE
ncbi:unannotated protein [freshwater metagenome]|uniref:Unannotated protein n=1 Tax=freshwater metagenome TaxID=449393 RepID=A0A6J6FFM3_9ZZZZ